LELLRRGLLREREHRCEEEAHVVEDGGDGGVDAERLGARRESREVGDQGRVERQSEGYMRVVAKLKFGTILKERRGFERQGDCGVTSTLG
jgi:hypothetical protein